MPSSRLSKAMLKYQKFLVEPEEIKNMFKIKVLRAICKKYHCKPNDLRRNPVLALHYYRQMLLEKVARRIQSVEKRERCG